MREQVIIWQTPDWDEDNQSIDDYYADTELEWEALKDEFNPFLADLAKYNCVRWSKCGRYGCEMPIEIENLGDLWDAQFGHSVSCCDIEAITLVREDGVSWMEVRWIEGNYGSTTRYYPVDASERMVKVLESIDMGESDDRGISIDCWLDKICTNRFFNVDVVRLWRGDKRELTLNERINIRQIA